MTDTLFEDIACVALFCSLVSFASSNRYSGKWNLDNATGDPLISTGSEGP